MTGIGALVASTILMSACDQKPAGAQSSPDFLYAFEDKNREQRLEVTAQGDEDISVVIEVVSPCQRRVQGAASAGPDIGDPEIEVDAYGDGYPVEVFTLDTADECRIEIRLAAGDREYAWIRESGCSNACKISRDAMTLR